MRLILLSLCCLLLTACAANANLQDDLDRGYSGNPVLDTPVQPAATDDAGFRAWVDDFTRRAINDGADPATARAVMARVAFQPRIIALDQKQPESQLTLQQYLDKTVSADRINTGRAKLTENADALDRVARQTGIPAGVIVALWGKETSYGAVTGGYSIADALATLAYEGRRRAFFEKELLAFMQVSAMVGRDPATLLGSWAGAMGQCQFMPTSYLKYAIDGDGDAIADIWQSRADVFASTANFLRQSGWQAGQPIAVPVRLTVPLDPGAIGRDKTPRRVSDWLDHGVAISGDADMPLNPDMPARLYAPDMPNGNGAGPAFLIFKNFDVLMRWNNSGYFATGVATLSSAVDR